MYERVSRIALDIDGTLRDYGGIIDKRTIELLLRYAHVGIVSSRHDCHRIASELGLGYACCSGVDKPSKTDCLRDYASRFPVPAGSIYIADMDYDFKSAKEAGWNYLNVNDICINLGAGGDVREGCMNIDIRILPGIDYVMDIEKEEIPLPDNTVRRVIMKDVLEHISWRNVLNVLRAVYNKMVSGGSIFIQTPDIEAIYERVIKPKDFRGDFKYRFEVISYWVGGSQDYPENTHKAFWDIDAMVELLGAVGFRDIKCENDGTNMVCTATK